MNSHIDKIRRDFESPYSFLDWFVCQWEDGADPKDIEHCIQACLKWMGAEWVEIIPGECIHIRAGIQESTIKPYPDWLTILIDRVGWRADQLAHRYNVVNVLIDSLYQFAWNKGRNS